MCIASAQKRECAERIVPTCSQTAKKEKSLSYSYCSLQITELPEVLREMCKADLGVNPTDLRRTSATDGLSAQQLSPLGLLEIELNRGQICLWE